MLQLLLIMITLTTFLSTSPVPTFPPKSPNSFPSTKQVIYHSGRTIAVVEVDGRNRMVVCWLAFKEEGQQIIEDVFRKTGKRADAVKKLNLEEMVQLMRDCQEADHVKKHKRNDQSNANTEQPVNILTYLRDQLMFKGTKWCGFGNTATNYFDIGSNRKLDRCCRAHDHCPVVQKRFTTLNPSPVSKMACECDRAFFDCLLSLKSKLADKVGNIFFNAGQVDCVEIRHPLKCSSWKNSEGSPPTGIQFGGNCMVWEEDDDEKPEVVITNLGMEYPYNVRNFRSSLDIQKLNTIIKNSGKGE